MRDQVPGAREVRPMIFVEEISPAGLFGPTFLRVSGTLRTIRFLGTVGFLPYRVRNWTIDRQKVWPRLFWAT
jgi:hypothetical protein